MTMAYDVLQQSRPLTSLVTPPQTHSSPNNYSRFCSHCFRNCHICSKSKGAPVLLLWNLLVGFIYGFLLFSVNGIFLSNQGPPGPPLSTLVHVLLGVYIFLGLIQVFYPVGGLVSDLCCGRYRIVTFSLFNIWIGLIFLSFVGLIQYYVGHHHFTIQIVCSVLFLILSVAGFSGFQSNVVQFGLDQLPDAPSQQLSAFLHWLVWTETAGILIMHILFTVSICSKTKIIELSPIGLFIINTLYLIPSYWIRHWFHQEPITHNPYGTVYKVLKFVVKHNKPIQRSAMTFCDDEIPTRIEFAKQRYGGPFTTETVEDVKTFLRILLMLLAIGPLSYFQVSTTYLFPLFGIHLGTNSSIAVTGCTYEWMLFQSGNLSYIISVITLPLYVIFFHQYIMKWVPKIMLRLGLGICLMAISVCSMFIIQVAANYNATKKNIISPCMFLAEYRSSKIREISQTLEFSVYTLIIPSLLHGIAMPLIYVTTLEFVSAQSPHTMKGLLLGVFYAFKGLFVTLGCVFTFPFTVKMLWKKDQGMFDCGFYYYLINTVIGMVGVVIFVIAAKWYRYRQREDQPYGPRYVEDYYHRYTNSHIEAAPITDNIDTSILAYGTMAGT